jgi:uncharacterized protein
MPQPRPSLHVDRTDGSGGSSGGLSHVQCEELLWVAEYVNRTAPLARSRDHGDRQWRSVALIGVRLAAETCGEELYPVLAFALLHDARRENEHYDPEHGYRAALLLDELADEGRLDLEAGVQRRLWGALERHDQGQTVTDPLVGVCWDADRLCLPRVGIDVDPELMSTPAGRQIPSWPATMIADPLAWPRLLTWAQTSGPRA